MTTTFLRWEYAARCEAAILAVQALMTRRWCDRDIRDHLKDEIEELLIDMQVHGIPLPSERSQEST